MLATLHYSKIKRRRQNTTLHVYCMHVRHLAHIVGVLLCYCTWVESANQPSPLRLSTWGLGLWLSTPLRFCGEIPADLLLLPLNWEQKSLSGTGMATSGVLPEITVAGLSGRTVMGEMQGDTSIEEFCLCWSMSSNSLLRAAALCLLNSRRRSSMLVTVCCADWALWITCCTCIWCPEGGGILCVNRLAGEDLPEVCSLEACDPAGDTCLCSSWPCTWVFCRGNSAIWACMAFWEGRRRPRVGSISEAGRGRLAKEQGEEPSSSSCEPRWLPATE